MTVLQDPPAFFDVDERLEAQIFICAVLDRTSRIDAVDVARGCRGILVRRCERLVLDHDAR
jgi:hypothetical protein